MLKHGFYRLLAPIHLRHALGQIREAERVLLSPEARFAIPFLFRGKGWFRVMRPRQNPEEIETLYRRVLALKPRRVLEIGTARGGTLYLWTQAAAPDATLISLDLPGGAFGGAYPAWRIPFYGAFAREKQTMHLLQEDSHLAQTSQKVKDLLQGASLDFLFIDGDHTYEGVKADFETYAPLVRPGGLVAFHDILDRPQVAGLEVHRFWAELKKRYPATEIIGGPNTGKQIGIGMIEKS